MSDFIPPTDAGFADWSTTFESGIDTEYATYGLTSGQATAYTTLDTAFQTAYALTINPATRTPVTIANKDSAKASAIANARALALIINAFPATTNGGRATLGLTPRGSGPTPIPAPVTKPITIIVGYNPLGHVLQIRDESTPTSNAKPFGAISCQVWGKVGPVAPIDISECRALGVYTKRFLELTFDGADAGKQMFYICRWQTRRGLVGPQSDLASATIPAA
jgi:hypothetical protein